MKQISLFFTIFLLLRYSANAQAPGSVNENFECGWHANDDIVDSEIQPDGKILLAGTFEVFNDFSVCELVRLNTDLFVDTSFNSCTSSLPAAMTITTIALQADGKILVGGYSSSVVGICRLNTDGSLDDTFDPGEGPGAAVHDIEVQPDGKILLGGIFGLYDDAPAKRLVRINEDGSIDPTFDTSIGGNSTIRKIALQPDGKILLGGEFSQFNGMTASRIVRLNADASVDETFDTGLGTNGTVYDIAVDDDGKIIIAGLFTKFDGLNIDGIARLNVNGSLDMAFDPGALDDPVIYSIALQSDHKILVAGNFESFDGIACDSYVRLNTNGSVDPSFLITPQINGRANKINKIDLQEDGKIILSAGNDNYINVNNSPRFIFARLNPEGAFDATYEYQQQAFNSYVYSLDLQPDGKIIVGGSFSFYGPNPITGIARINGDGSLDTNFISPPSVTSAEIVKLQADGKILVGVDAGLKRLNANGSNDNTFATAQYGLFVEDIIIQPDGIIIGGSDLDGEAILIHRLHPDGTEDTSFHTGSFQNNGGLISDDIQCIEQDNDGKLLVGGDLTKYNLQPVNNILRINTDGTIDSTFLIGTGPSYSGDEFDPAFPTVTDIRIIQGNKILVVGNFTGFNGTDANGLVRLNPDGSVDNTFTAPTHEEIGGNINQILIMPDGKIVCSAFDDPHQNFIFLRLNNDGSVDETFEQNHTIASSVSNADIEDILLLGNGNLVLGGEFSGFGHYTKDKIVWVHGQDFICGPPVELSHANVTSTTALIYWDPVPGIEKYTIWYRIEGESWLKKSTGLTQKKLKGLSPSTTYRYKIRTDCGETNSEFSVVKTFTTLPLRTGDPNNYKGELFVDVYPSPNHGEFTIACAGFSGQTATKIFDLNGRLIYEDNFSMDENSSKNISVQNYKGLAIMEITNAQNTIAKSIVIQ